MTDWMLTPEELDQILETGGTAIDYQTETCIAQSRKLLEYLIAKALKFPKVLISEEVLCITLPQLESMLKELEEK